MSMAYFPLDLTPAAMPGASASAGALGLQLPAEDAGVGLTFRRCWVVQTREGGRLRWLAPWIQRRLAEAWNLPLTLVRVEAVRSCMGFAVAGVTAPWLALHAEGGVVMMLWLAASVPLVAVLLGPNGPEPARL